MVWKKLFKLLSMHCRGGVVVLAEMVELVAGVELFNKLAWLLLLCVVAVMDFRYRKIKNIILLILFFLSIINVLFLDKEKYLFHIICALFLFLIFVVFYALGFMGAGDVKFAISIGLFFGVSKDIIFILIISSIISGAHSCIYFLYRRMWSNIFFEEKIRKIPYAGYMAIAAVGCMIYLPKP